jgi:hypothetical protein
MDCTYGKTIPDADVARGLGSVSIGAEAEQEYLPVAIRQPVYQVINEAKEVRRSARLKLPVVQGELSVCGSLEQGLKFRERFRSTIQRGTQPLDRNIGQVAQAFYAQGVEDAIEPD